MCCYCVLLFFPHFKEEENELKLRPFYENPYLLNWGQKKKKNLCIE